MLPLENLNWNLVKAVVTLKYPATNNLWQKVPPDPSSLPSLIFISEKKCFTKVVFEGSKICKVPLTFASFWFPMLGAKVWKDVPWAWSLGFLYASWLSSPSSPTTALKAVDVIVSL